jgi:hypothetical protein
MIKLHSRYSEIDTTQWNDLVLNSSTASFFQTPECFKFYESLSFLKLFVYGISENDELKAVVCGYIISDGNILKRFFSRRAIIPGGLLISNDISNEALQHLLQYSTKMLSKESIYIEIRNYNDYSAFSKTFELSGFIYQAHLNFHLDTSSIDIITNRLKSNKKRYIKVSQKEGAYWEETKNENEIKDFYAILRELYVSKVKTPLFPIEFFLRLSTIDCGKIIVVKYKGKVIGGASFVVLPNKTMYEWFVCGEDRKYKNVYPSILSTWAGIEYANKNNFNRFDFMGAGKPDVHYGVRDFKSEFGGTLVEHGRYLYVCKPALYRLGKKVIQILKKKK